MRPGNRYINCAAIPAPIAIMDADTDTTWHDSSLSVQGTADGLRVGAISNKLGSGVTMISTAGTGAGPVLLKPCPDTGMNCYEFDGNPVSATFFAGTSLRDCQDAVSIAMLVYAINNPINGSSTIVFSSRGATGYGNGLCVELQGPGALLLRIGAGSASGGPDIRGGWARLIAVWDGAKCVLWYNGAVVLTATARRPQHANIIRCPFSNAPGLWGKVNYYEVAPRAWTQQEINARDTMMATRVTAATALIEAVPTTSMSPTQLGSEMWWDTYSGMTSSGSLATPGSSVDSWAPSLGSLTLTTPGGLTSPIYASYKNTPALYFPAGATANLAANLGATRSVSAFTVNVVFRRIARAVSHPLVTLGATRTDPTLKLDDILNHQSVWTGVSNGTSAQIGQFPILDDELHYASYTFDGANRLCRMLVDGAECCASINVPGNVHGVQSSVASFTQGGVGLGYVDATYAGGIQVFSLDLRLAAATAKEHRQGLAWARSYYQAAFAGWDTAPVCCWLGSSSALINDDTDTDVPGRVRRMVGDIDRWYIFATGSTFSWTGRSRSTRNFQWLMKGRTGAKIACVLYGSSNDLSLGLSAAALQVEKTNLWTALAAYNATYVVDSTYLPYSGIVYATRTTLNSTIRASATSTILIADQGSDPLIGVDGAELVALYFPDGIHMSPTATEIDAPYWAIPIASLIPGTGTGTGTGSAG